jgi:hypothetical protein
LLARPGERVERGAVLARLQREPEAVELSRSTREFELELLKVLQNPSDQAARAQISTLRAQRQVAEARVEERFVRAPISGLVSDVRVRAGQPVAAGQLVLTMVNERATASVVAMVPGHDRPLLRPGMTMHVALDGFEHARQEVRIDSVADEVVGPAEIKRYLGADLADAVAVEGPVVLVHAGLATPYFRAQERQLPYYDGMKAVAEVKVRSERILTLLIPGLASIFGDPNE